MSDLQTYFQRQEVTRRWRAEVENATARLELALVKERLAECHSQHQPVADTCMKDEDILSDDYKHKRANVLAIATYVATGKKP